MAEHTAVEVQKFDSIFTSTLGAESPNRHAMPAEPGVTPSSPTTDILSESSAFLPESRTALVNTLLCCLSFIPNFCNGVVVVALPAMQNSLSLQEGLLTWPASGFYLAAGSFLLLAGSVTDVVGSKRMNLIGSFLSAVSVLACGLAQTGGDIIAFRALQGIAYAIVAPSSISIVSNSMKEGPQRNIGFACLGFAQPLGYCFGLVLAGVFTDTVGWRAAFYLPAAASLSLFLVSIWVLPQDPKSESGQSIKKRLVMEIDWVGVFIASMGVSTLSYALTMLSADISSIHKASSIGLLVTSCLSIPSFVMWMHYQTKNHRPALIPNSLWSSAAFTSICSMVFFSTALAACMALYSSIFFQRVQGHTALGASLRVLPSLLVGTIASIATGFFVHRMPVLWILLISSIMSTMAPLLMALARIDQPYWENAFFAQIFSPLSCDVLFTVSLLIITGIFPRNLQALSGAVFNTCAELGIALGISVSNVISSSVTNESSYPNKPSTDDIMKGYRVAFLGMFGWTVLVCLICMVGLRRVGRIGVPQG